MMTFAEKLQQLRDQARLSQAALALKTGLSLRSIQNWEQGYRCPRAQALLALARALGVPVETLITCDDRPRGGSRSGAERLERAREGRRVPAADGVR